MCLIFNLIDCVDIFKQINTEQDKNIFGTDAKLLS